MSLSNPLIGLLILALFQFTLANVIKNPTQNDNLIVETPLGAVQGHILQSREGRDYYAFYKVPYAQPPIGELRFKSPQPATKWEGVRNETQIAIQCIQKDKYNPIDEAVGDEDCLYMNIYLPKLPSANGTGDLMPTLFYIHGGGFTDGNGSRYGGKYFLDEDVVLITFQYRLGPFGFLSTEDGEIGGNMGFKDQVMGLKWVQQYVRYFGGDPDRVMIFGNSAGGFSVSNLMISPMANGLFHTAISESGGGLCPALAITTKESANRTLYSLASNVNCSTGNQSSIIECLREASARDLAIVRNDDIHYYLTVETYDRNSPDNYMPDTPYNMLKGGRVNRVPWIIGVNSAEAVGSSLGLLLETQVVDILNSNFAGLANEILQLNLNSTVFDAMGSDLQNFYFGNQTVGNHTERNLTNLLSDRMFVHCTKVQAELQAQYSDVYLYYLSKKPEKSYADPIAIFYPPGDYGASHADELQYLFNYNGYPEYPPTSPYYSFSWLLIKIWTQFARTGNPAGSGINWERIYPGQKPLPWFELNENPKTTNILQARMDFWDQFPDSDLSYEQPVGKMWKFLD